MTPLFFSTFMYAPCKVIGVERWPAALEHELKNLDESPWHGFRTLGQAVRVAECRVHVDASTYIDRARCVAAGNFLYRAGKDCDVWVTCDDDVYADADVIERLVEVARQTRGLCALPYVNRDGGSMTYRKVSPPTKWLPHPVRDVDRVGMGLVALHRDLVEKLAMQAEHFRESVRPEDPNMCPYIFRNGVEDGTFMGEDFGFCRLADEAGLPMHVLLDAEGMHMQTRAMLDLEGRVMAFKEPSTRNDLPRAL